MFGPIKSDPVESAIVGAHLGLKDRSAIVTGAASGMGRAAALMLADYGVRVLATDIDENGLASLPEMSSAPDQLHTALADLGQTPECAGLVDRALREFGRLDILVNAAGVLQRRDIENIDEDDWDRTMNVNLKSQFFLCKAASVPMRAARWGRMINVSSMGAHTGGNYNPDQISSTPYIVSKGGILALTKSLSKQLARFNICVNAIAPGNVDTPLMRAGLSDAGFEAMKLRNPLGRLGDAREMAWGVVFLASDLAGYITGHTLDINGGANAR